MTEQILVVGSGIAGMCTSMALARKGFAVTLLERDGQPPEGDADKAFFEWARRGASQFRHPHAFLGLMCNLLQDNYPDLLEAFYAAGARKVGFKDMLSPELSGKYTPEPGDEKLFVLMCRRATIETVLRRYVSSFPGVRVLNGVHVDGLLSEKVDGKLVARGVKVRRDCVEKFGAEIRADVVVDASGRTTKFPGWLEAEGIYIREESDDAEIVYYTRHYKLKPGQAEPPRGGKDRSAGDLGYIKFGVFPGDNGNFALIVCVHNDEKELREAIKDSNRFDTICRSIPGLLPWVAPEVSEPTTASFGIGDIRSVWRHWVQDGQPLIRNFFAVGDASLRTNPLYGRGCSTGIMHAHLLADVLVANPDADARAVQFSERTESELRPIHQASLREDRNGIRRSHAVRQGKLLDQAKAGFKGWFEAAFGDAMASAARHNLHVTRGMMRTFNLLEKPGEFLKDRKTQAIVFLYMLRGRTKNAAARIVRGPTRDETLKLIESTKG
ncbi:MAG: FAD-dependent oxidoreductase [Gammaproteobacteria bacterium]|nr:FAD-dependent oxidoreductase [Gammaproteobacteria bacterium]